MCDCAVIKKLAAEENLDMANKIKVVLQIVLALVDKIDLQEIGRAGKKGRKNILPVAQIKPVKAILKIGRVLECGPRCVYQPPAYQRI